ncbi:hypothetical protein D3C73_1372290 [compost metagenome]
MDGIWDVVAFVAKAIHQADADVCSCAQLLDEMQKQDWYSDFAASLKNFHQSRYHLSKASLTAELPEMA